MRRKREREVSTRRRERGGCQYVPIIWLCSRVDMKKRRWLLKRKKTKRLEECFALVAVLQSSSQSEKVSNCKEYLNLYGRSLIYWNPHFASKLENTPKVKPNKRSEVYEHDHRKLASVKHKLISRGRNCFRRLRTQIHWTVRRREVYCTL